MTFFESIFYMAWRGIAIGIIISAPMGPVGMLCIQRTIDRGRRAGLYTGIGAALSDLFYCLLTGFGLSFIEEFLEKNQNIIQLLGSGVLIAFGIYLFRRNPSKDLKKPTDENVSVKKSILGGFLFTFSNPLILFLIIGLFARFNFLLPEFRLYQYLTGFAFIFVGALIWWWLITFAVDKVSHHFNIRSMWLINKIIGAIILLFAVVGIITASSALAKGAKTECWNGRRGYGPFAAFDNPQDNTLVNRTTDTIFCLTPVYNSPKAEFRCKVRNNKTKTDWGFIIKGNNGEQLNIGVHSDESEFDGISSSAALQFSFDSHGSPPTKATFTDTNSLLQKINGKSSGPDPTGALNFYKVALDHGELTLYGGLHSAQALLSAKVADDFLIDSIGFFLPAGASISPFEIRLDSYDAPIAEGYYGSTNLTDEYFQLTHDPLEGYWQILDRSLEETLLKMGGNYRLALVRNGEGYELIYLSGAQINASGWEPGMIKAHLLPSGIPGAWDAIWYDAMHNPLQKDIKAQFDADGILKIRFPYQDSEIRLYHNEGETPD